MRFILSLLIAFLASALSAQAPLPNFMRGCIANLEYHGGVSASGTWRDISGNGNDGTLSNLTAIEMTGLTQGLTTPYVAGYVNLPATTASLKDATAATVEFWVYLTNSSGGICLYDDCTNSNDFFRFAILYNFDTTDGADRLSFTRRDLNSGDQGARKTIIANTTMSRNAWHHIAAVLSVTDGVGNGFVKLYQDGVEVKSSTSSVYAMTSTVSYGVRLANDFNTSAAGLLGYLDCFKLYKNRALPAEEIYQHYKTGRRH